MSNLQKIWRRFVWEEIKKPREGYFVVYRPINRINENYASLDLMFLFDMEIEQIAKIMERELKFWIQKYPVPTILFSYDKSEDKIIFKNIRGGDFLLGYLGKGSNELIQIWGDFEKVLTSEALINITHKELVKIYSELNYKTIDEMEDELHQKINEKRRIKKLVDIYFYLWLAISILIAALGFKSYLVGLIAFLYSLYKLYKKVKEHKGFKTKKQKKDDEIMLKMRHYYYHCEKNPKGFLKLKQENFEKRIQERILQENIKIRNKDDVISRYE